VRADFEGVFAREFHVVGDFIEDGGDGGVLHKKNFNRVICTVLLAWRLN
jgi:hypothetical protein